MNKKKIIIANWKMNPASQKEAEKLFVLVARGVKNIKKTEIAVCPPFVYLERLKKLSKKVSLGAQNVFWMEKGAYTGEISPLMLTNLGLKYVIVGHSERRALGETNIDVNNKIKMALANNLIPIMCVGESARDENHEYFDIIKAQLEEGLQGLQKGSVSKVIIAYEPVWALSTTQNRRDATPQDSREMVIYIRKVLVDKYGLKIEMPRIIYGGSFNEKNANDFLKNGDIDGALVGGASLDANKFLEIIKTCEALKN